MDRLDNQKKQEMHIFVQDKEVMVATVKPNRHVLNQINDLKKAEGFMTEDNVYYPWGQVTRIEIKDGVPATDLENSKGEGQREMKI